MNRRSFLRLLAIAPIAAKLGAVAELEAAFDPCRKFFDMGGVKYPGFMFYDLEVATAIWPNTPFSMGRMLVKPIDGTGDYVELGKIKDFTFDSRPRAIRQSADELASLRRSHWNSPPSTSFGNFLER